MSMPFSLTTTPSFNSLSMAESCILSLPSLFSAKNKTLSPSIPSKRLNLHLPCSNSSLFPLTTNTTRLPSLLTFVAQTSDWAQEEEDNAVWENQVDTVWGTEEGGDDGVEEVTGGGFAQPTEEVKIFVGNLPYDVDSEILASLFKQAGTVEVAEVIYNRVTDRSRGFGFVTMSTLEEVEKAVEKFSGYELNGRVLTVNKFTKSPIKGNAAATNVFPVKNPVNLLNSQGSFVLLRVPSVARNFLHSSSPKWTCGSKHLRFSFSSLRAWCASSSSSSNMYGGWNDLGSSDAPGESHALRNFLVSVGIDDRKNVFVFLLGLVCAMAISRVKVSSIVVLPASALVFAVGFTVGFFRNGAFGEVRASGSKRREKEDNSNSKLSSEKLRSLVEFFDELDLVVNNLKSDVQSAIRNNKIRVDDFYGYVVVTDKIKISVKNARNVVRSLIDNEENSGGILVENHKSGRRKKQGGERGYQMLQSFSSLFAENLFSSNSTKVRENVKQEAVDRTLDQTRGNGTMPVVEDKALNFVDEHKGSELDLDPTQGSSTNSVLDMNKNGRIRTTPEGENFGLGDIRRSNNKFFDDKKHSYRNKGLRFTNNRSFSLKMDSSSITDMWESHDNLLDSESFKVRTKRMESESSFTREQLLNQGHKTFRSSHDLRESGSDRSQYKDDTVNYDDHRHLADDLSAHENEFNTASSAKISDDMMFDRYLDEATDLLKQAKEFIKVRQDEEQAEIMLYRSANILSKAVDLKPMSLLAVGQLGNTYLLHGELKLKISRELRTLLSGSIQPSSGKHSRILKGLRNKITCEEDVASFLIDVCEECEELLVQAGRKYRLALSIDANDVRALYNWGLALSFRGQLIADIGPGAAFEAERVFLAAIDKFDAMLLKGNVYAPDALFRWGVALQQRSRLRPGSSKEKVKLLQQAKRLYEDALHMDTNNIQVKDALSSCVTELNYRQF